MQVKLMTILISRMSTSITTSAQKRRSIPRAPFEPRGPRAHPIEWRVDIAANERRWGVGLGGRRRHVPVFDENVNDVVEKLRFDFEIGGRIGVGEGFLFDER